MHNNVSNTTEESGGVRLGWELELDDGDAINDRCREARSKSRSICHLESDFLNGKVDIQKTITSRAYFRPRKDLLAE